MASAPRCKLWIPFVNHLLDRDFCTNLWIPLNLCISMTSYLFSILTVTTHAFHLMSLSSSHLLHSKSLVAPTHMLHSAHLWNQLPTSLRIPNPNYSFPSQQPLFEHAGLSCYTMRHHFFTVSLWAQNLPCQKILSFTLVRFCLSEWSHGSKTVHRIYLLIGVTF